MNNARRTLNVRAENSQFPSIVSLAFVACFMHFIISRGASEEREARQLRQTLISARGGVLRSYRTSFERQISQLLGVEDDCIAFSLNQYQCQCAWMSFLFIHKMHQTCVKNSLFIF